MPGIYGFFANDKDLDKTELETLSVRMGRFLCHRKDLFQKEFKAAGTFLGKIDFPGLCTTNRIFWDNDKSIAIMLDGAIFSYQTPFGFLEVHDYGKLVSELGQEFKKTGVVDVQRLNGEFNLVIYDCVKKRLLLANDKWGFRELYYYHHKDFFIFAPEIKALLECTRVPMRLNEQAVIDFYHCGYILGNRTFFMDISLLPAGSVCIIDDQGMRINSRQLSCNPSLSSNDYEAHLDTAYDFLDLSIQRRIRNSHRPAITISGGLDSRLISAFAVKHHQCNDFFTIGDSHCKEYTIANKVAMALEIKSHKNVIPSWKDIIKYYEWLIWISGGMVSLGYTSTSFGCLFRDLQPNDLLLGGFGGDHILGGSRITPDLLTVDLPFEKRLELALRRTRANGDCSPFKNILFEIKFLQQFDFYSIDNVKEELGRVSQNVEHPSYQHDFFLYSTRYRRCLNQARGLVGHFCINQYYPFFDNDFFNFMYSLPPHLRIKSGFLIDLFKKHLPQLAAIPWLKTGVSLYDNKSARAIMKEKMLASLRWKLKRASFGKIELPNKENYAEHDRWYRSSREFKYLINSVLLDDRTLSRGFLKKEGITSIIKMQEKGWDYFSLLDRIFVFEVFCRLFFDGEDKKYISKYDVTSIE